MRTFTLPLMLAAGLGLATPVVAQDLEDVIGGIAQSLIQQELDKNAYLAAQEANTAAAYRDYLAKFPKGIYRGNALQALERLGATAETSSAAEAEARLRITFAQRVAVQRELTRLGYSTRGTDGVWGRNRDRDLAARPRGQGNGLRHRGAASCAGAGGGGDASGRG